VDVDETNVAVARAQLADGDCRATRRLLRRLEAGQPPLPNLVEALLLDAEAAVVCSDENRAVESATTAIQLAATESRT